MSIIVVKKSGLLDSYDTNKILNAILKAANSAGYTIETKNSLKKY